MMFHWPAQAARQQTRRLTESWWGPSGELNVSCCAKLQKNNSSSSCPQRKTEGSGKQRQPCQQGPQCLIIMLSTRDGRFTTCPLIVCALGYSRCGRLTHWLQFLFQSQGQFMWLCGCIINLPAVNAGSSTEAKQNMPLLSVLVHFAVGPPIHICPKTVDGALHNQLVLFQNWQQIPSERW